CHCDCASRRRKWRTRIFNEWITFQIVRPGRLFRFPGVVSLAPLFRSFDYFHNLPLLLLHFSGCVKQSRRSANLLSSIGTLFLTSLNLIVLPSPRGSS